MNHLRTTITTILVALVLTLPASAQETGTQSAQYVGSGIFGTSTDRGGPGGVFGPRLGKTGNEHGAKVAAPETN